jgi:CheY-like chemotaxis protein
MLEARQIPESMNFFDSHDVDGTLKFRAEPPEPPRLLVAHHDPARRFALMGGIGREGYIVAQAADGAEVLEHLANGLLDPFRPWVPDVIVTQSNLPLRSGLDLLADLRHEGWVTPFVLLCGANEPRAKRTTESASALRLHEPVNEALLRQVVRRLVNVTRSGSYGWAPRAGTGQTSLRLEPTRDIDLPPRGPLGGSGYAL